MASTTDPRHKKLEQDVNDYLAARGFKTTEATYHSVMPREIQDILRYRFTATALYIRGRADRIATHPSNEIDFEFECKTHETLDPQYQDLTIELLPLVHHISKSRLGVRCLYCCRNNLLNVDCGFWIEHVPPVRVIMSSTREYYEPLDDLFYSITQSYFPGVPVAPCFTRYGSGDPFVIIDTKYWHKLPNWKSLIDSVL